jgi:hypothetical protein
MGWRNMRNVLKTLVEELVHSGEQKPPEELLPAAEAIFDFQESQIAYATSFHGSQLGSV